MASMVGRFIAIDTGGSRLRGYESINNLEFQGVGVTHTKSLPHDLARNITSAIPAGISEVDILVLSLAAIPQSNEDRQLLAAAILQRVKFVKLVITSDTKAAAIGGDTNSDLVIAVGTGITAIVKTASSNFELTGHGYLIGDEASGYSIGRNALNAALKATEGRGPATSLTAAAENFYKVKANLLADFIHQLPNPVAQIASFAPSVSAAANTGDAEALSIITKAAHEIFELIRIAIKRAQIKTVALVGGALPIGGLMHNQILEAGKDLGITFVSASSEPLSGAKKIAVDPNLQRNLISISANEIATEIWSKLYLSKLQELLREVTNSQQIAISASVELFADALTNGNLIHTFGTGHSHLLAAEIFYRAGGLAAIYPIFDERLMLHKEVVKGSQNERLPGLARELVAKHKISTGDVVIVISNSGGNQVTIDLVKLAQEAGAKVIAVTSVNHASSGLARSNSSEKIHQIADVVLDNSGVVGDAAVKIVGSKMAVAPTSTVVGGALLQSVVVGAVAELIKRGIEPEIFLSSNLTGGDENNSAIFAKYNPLIDLYN